MNANGRSTEPKLVFLGTGTPRIDPDRCGACQAIIADHKAFLVDCGPGALHQAARAYQQGVTSLNPINIHTIFLTHLHSDHCLGLPEFILSPWVVGRTEPLHIYGPPGTQSLVDSILIAFQEDIIVRSTGLESTSKNGLVPVVTEYETGLIYASVHLKVTAFPVHHRNWPFAFGFIFEMDGLKIVFSGDTSPCPAIHQASEGADALIHEVYAISSDQPEDRPGGDSWPQYMKEFHTSTRELGDLCFRSRVKRLFLNHILRKDESNAELIAEVKQSGFPGEIIVPNDLDSYSL